MLSEEVTVIHEVGTSGSSELFSAFMNLSLKTPRSATQYVLGEQLKLVTDSPRRQRSPTAVRGSFADGLFVFVSEGHVNQGITSLFQRLTVRTLEGTPGRGAACGPWRRRTAQRLRSLCHMPAPPGLGRVPWSRLGLAREA